MILKLFSPNSPLGRWLQFLLDALLISLAWLLCSLPVVTIGAATAAAYRMGFNWVRERGGCDVRVFFASFRENLRGATGIWLVLLPCLLLILADGYLIWLSSFQMPQIARWMFFIAAAVWACTAEYAFALQAQFVNPVFRTLGNALRIALSHLPATVMMLFIHAIALFLCIMLPYLSFIFIVAAIFLSARPCWNVFLKLVRRKNRRRNRRTKSREKQSAAHGAALVSL